MFNYEIYDEDKFGDFFNEEHLFFIKDYLKDMDMSVKEIESIEPENLLDTFWEIINQFNRKEAKKEIKESILSKRKDLIESLKSLIKFYEMKDDVVAKYLNEMLEKIEVMELVDLEAEDDSNYLGLGYSISIVKNELVLTISCYEYNNHYILDDFCVEYRPYIYDIVRYEHKILASVEIKEEDRKRVRNLMCEKKNSKSYLYYPIIMIKENHIIAHDIIIDNQRFHIC